MDRQQIPPQLLGVDPNAALMAGSQGLPPPGMGQPPTGPGAAGPLMGTPPPNPMMPALAGIAPGMDAAAAAGPMGMGQPATPPPMNGGVQGGDPILQQLLQGMRQQPINPELLKPKTERKGYRKKPDRAYMEEAVVADHLRHQRLIDRFAKDLELWRQEHKDNLPPMFDRFREVAWKAATISNVVTKLTNMSSATDWRYVVPFKDEKSKENSQIVENWYSYLNDCEEDLYAIAGGDASLQWDEYFYLYQYGRIVCRCLPDSRDEHYPYNSQLLDPATCFPTFGDSKEGMIRMTRMYESSLIDVITTYSDYDPDIEVKMLRLLGHDPYEAGRYYHETGTVYEYWDTWHRGVRYKDIWIMEEEHELGYVPFIYVTARGEPRAVSHPTGSGLSVDEFGNAIAVGSANNRADLEHKGVSVFHHIKNTHRMAEIVYTLLLSEVLKAQNPAYIQYVAPQMAGVAPPPVRTTPGANNQRVLNAQKVEIVPTSPRPTDTSPVLNRLQGDFTEGTINPAMYGSMDGSNIAGFAVESLISAARDTILPYQQAFTRYKGLKARMWARQYLSHISSVTLMSVSMEGKYGSSPSADVTPEAVQSTGIKVQVEMIGISDSALPAMVNTSASAVKEGFWSRRKAMEKLGEKDPSKMLQDIIVERAIEHPEIMENVIIPQMMFKAGQNDLAYMWGFMVVLPKLMNTMGGLMGGMMPGMPQGIPGPGGTPPSLPGMPAMPGLPSGQPQANTPNGGGGVNGMSNPQMGRSPAPPTGPLPGQGRQ